MIPINFNNVRMIDLALLGLNQAQVYANLATETGPNGISLKASMRKVKLAEGTLGTLIGDFDHTLIGNSLNGDFTCLRKCNMVGGLGNELFTCKGSCQIWGNGGYDRIVIDCNEGAGDIIINNFNGGQISLEHNSHITHFSQGVLTSCGNRCTQIKFPSC